MIPQETIEERTKRWDALQSEKQLREQAPLTLPKQEDDKFARWDSLQGKMPSTEQARPFISDKGIFHDIGAGVKETAGFIEAPAAVASGIPGFIGGLLSQAATGLYDIWKTGGRDIAGPEELVQTFGSRADVKHQVSQLLTHEPKTETGKMLTEVAVSPIVASMHGLDQGIKQISDDPETQEGIKFFAEALLVKVLPKISKSVKTRKYTKAVYKQVMKLLENEAKGAANQVQPLQVGGHKLLSVEDVGVITKQIKALKPFSRKQKAMLGKEFGKRIIEAEAAGRQVGGRAGYYAKRGKLKGEYEKVKERPPDFEALQDILSPEKETAAFNTIEYNDILWAGEKLSAGEGLDLLLAGRLPQAKQLEYLGVVFGGEFVSALLKKRKLIERAWSGALDAANVPRSIMAGFFDLSFGGRQGIFSAPRNYREFGNSWARQFKLFGSEKAYQALTKVITSDPYYKLAREAEVGFTDLGALKHMREERYLSPMAEKIPIIGKGIRMTGRAYTGFANKYRMDIFRRMAKDAEAMGHKLAGNPDLLQPMGGFVNALTGRGGLWKLESAAAALNAVFFSPRLWSSRMGLLFGKYNPLNPLHYMMLPKNVRVEALKTWLAFGGSAATVLGAAKMAGAEVGTDPRSAGFLKMKFGDTYVSILGGLQPQIRTAYQFITGQSKSSTTGQITTTRDKPGLRGEVLTRHITYKEAPIASFITNWVKGKTGMEKFSLSKEAQEKLIPIVAQDMWDIYKDDPGLLPMGLFSLGAVFGLGIQTYGGEGTSRMR